MGEVIEPFTADEAAVLEIAANGQEIAEIGRWEQPVLALVKRGYLAGPNFSRSITAAGEAAWAAYDRQTDEAIGSYITSVRKVQQEQQQIAQLVQQSAALLATAAIKSAEIRGDAAEYSLGRWFELLKAEAEAALREMRS